MDDIQKELIISELKKIIKLILTPWVYQLIRNYNSTPNIDTNIVITGGDAINYYIEDSNLLTKDFDLKFCYNNLLDWKYYNDKNNFNGIINIFEHLSGRLIEFCNAILPLLKSKENEISTQLSNYINRNVKIIFSNELVKVNLFGQIDENKNDNSPEYNYLYYNLSRNVYPPPNNTRYTKYSRISIVYELQIDGIVLYKNNRPVPITEGLFDTVCWSPICFGYGKYYTTKKPNYILDSNNIYKSVHHSPDLSNYYYSLIDRNFSFIKTNDGLYVVTISFVIWDTVRMLNEISGYLSPTITSQWNRPNYTAIESYKKYSEKYYYVIEALFSKLRCVQPFTDALAQCASNANNNNAYNINYSIDQQVKKISQLLNVIN